MNRKKNPLNIFLAMCGFLAFFVISPHNIPHAKSAYMSLTHDVVPPDSDIVPPDQDVIPPKSDAILPDEEVMPPDEEVMPPDEEVMPPNSDVLPPDQGQDS
jgi:hypothetical protein